VLACRAMRIWYFLVVVLLLGVGVGVGVFVRGGSLTGEVVKELGEYSYTRAICSDGECMDVVISCSGGNVVEIVPVFYLIEHKEGWVDPRDGESFCG